MIASMDAVQKCNIVARMIGQPHTEHLSVELDRLRHIPREQQDMSQTAGMGASHCATEWCSALTGTGDAYREFTLFVWRGLRGNLDLDQISVVIMKPDPIGVDARRRIEPLDPHRLQALREFVDVLLECSERHVTVLLAWSFADRAPFVRVPFSVDRENVASFPDV